MNMNKLHFQKKRMLGNNFKKNIKHGMFSFSKIKNIHTLYKKNTHWYIYCINPRKTMLTWI